MNLMLDNKSLLNRFDNILLLSFIIFTTLAFFNAWGSSDVNRFWLRWMQIMSESGFINGFERVHADYPALSMYFLHLIERTATALDFTRHAVLKFTTIAFLFASSFVYWRITRDILTTVLMHFMLILSAAMLAYLDIYYTPFLILSLWALKDNKPIAATIFFTVCCSIKYQPLIIAPFFAVYLYKIYQQTHPENPLAQTAKTILIPAMMVSSIMFLVLGKPFVMSFYHAFIHSKFSFQAFNIHWIYINLVSLINDVPLRHIEHTNNAITYGTRILFVIFYAYVLKKFFDSKKDFSQFLFFTITGFYSYFILVSGVHENHLYIAAIVASLLFIVKEEYRVITLFIMLMSNMNMLLFNGMSGKGLPFTTVFIFDMTLAIATINSIFYCFLLYKVSKNN